MQPIRIILHGPPAAGKTLLAKQLCEKYDLTYLHVKNVIEDTVTELENKINLMQQTAAELEEQENEFEETEEEDEEDADLNDEKPTLEDYQNQLEEIQKALSSSKTGKISEDLVIRLIKQKMYTNKLLNQGWVLDGYPKSLHEANELFGLGNKKYQSQVRTEISGNGGSNLVFRSGHINPS